MDGSLLQADIELRLKTVDAVYGAVLEPKHYTVIIDAVNGLFKESVAEGGDTAEIAALLASFGAHMTSASRLFDMARPGWHRSLQDIVDAKPFAAMAMTDGGRVVMSNAAAVAMLGAPKTVVDLPLRADAHADVRAFLDAVSRSGAAAPIVVSGWHPSDDRALLFLFQAIDGRWQDFADLADRRPPSGRIVLVKSTETQLSQYLWRLADEAFDFTPAEREVVKELTEGRSLKEIASRRLRSLNTVKTQLRAVLTKTGTRSQGQLLCLVTALAHLAEAPEREANRPQPLNAPKRGSVVLKSVTLSDGRTMKYVESGAPTGKPVLLLAPTNRPDFTNEIVEALCDRNLRVICPVRPGSWGMPRWPQCSPSNAAPLFLSLLDKLSLGRCVLAGLRTGGSYAIELALRVPERFNRLVLIDTGAPLDRIAKLVAMPPWPRTLYTTARLFPDLLILPFRYCSSDFHASAQGERRAVETFYRDSPVDENLLRDPRNFEIGRRNLAYYFEDPDQVVRDIGFWARDCSRDLEDVCRRLPVCFLHGSANTAFPPADIHSFCARNIGASARIVDGAAMFLVYSRPETLAEVLDRAVDPEAGTGRLELAVDA